MRNDIKESVKKTLVEKVNILKVVREDLKKLENYSNSLETQILDFCDVYGIENGDIQWLNVKEVPKPKKVPLKEILDVFPNLDIRMVLENVVCEIGIDLEKTEDNLRFSANFPDPIIKSIVKQLAKLSKETVKKVDV